MKYVIRELELQTLSKRIRWAVLYLILSMFGAVPGYLVGGGLYLSSKSYDSPYLAWTAQQLQDVMGSEGWNGPKAHAFQDWIAERTKSEQGYRVQIWKQEAQAGVAADWDFQHWNAISAWLGDDKSAFIEACVTACGSALLVFALAVVALLAITWERLTRGRRRLRSLTKRDSGENPICIDGVPLPQGEAYEPHLLVAARTGMGKSVLMHLLIPQMRACGMSGFVPDYGGELIRHHARRGDLIFNPFDRRGLRYSLLADVSDELTRIAVCRALFPSGQNDVHNYFQDAGALILSEALATATTNVELWETLCDRKLLLEKLKLSPAAIFMEQGTKEANSYLTTLMVKLNCLANLPASAGSDERTFSFRKFVHQSRNKPGRFCWCVIPEQAKDALRPFVSTLSGILISEILSLSPAPGDWKFLLCTDELGLIPPIDNFGNALTNGRKAGLFVMSAVQTIEQIKRNYGSEAKDILGSFGTKLILGQGDAESAEFWSKEIGATEVREWLKSKGNASSDGRKSSTVSRTEHVRIRPRVLAHELRELQKLQGYLQIGPYPAARIFLRAPSNLVEAVSKVFVPRQPNDEPSAGQALRMRARSVSSVQLTDPATTSQPTTNQPTALDLGALATNAKART